MGRVNQEMARIKREDYVPYHHGFKHKDAIVHESDLKNSIVGPHCEINYSRLYETNAMDYAFIDESTVCRSVLKERNVVLHSTISASTITDTEVKMSEVLGSIASDTIITRSRLNGIKCHQDYFVGSDLKEKVK